MISSYTAVTITLCLQIHSVLASKLFPVYATYLIKHLVIEIMQPSSIEINPMITALFKNTRIMKFKSQLMITFSLPSIILADLSENKTLLQRVQKVMHGICHWWILIRFGCFCVSRFVVMVITIDGKDKRNCEGGF